MALGVAWAARGVPGFVTGPDGTQFSAPSAAGAYLAAAASVLAAGLILWSGLARRSLYLWLVLVLFSEALVVWFSTFGGGRYTVAWYGARVEGILASVVVLALLATHFRQLQRRLGASVEQLQERTEALQAEMHQRERAERMLAQSQKLEAVGQLAAGLAHDLNNFMQAINVRAELIRRRAGQLVEADVAVVQGNVRKAEQLTRQLMLVAGRRQLQPRTVSLQQIIPPLVDSFRHLLGAKHRVEASVPENAWPVFLDPTEFEIALTNLLTNARDAQEAGGAIVLSVANMAGPDNDADCVAIEVLDQGRGIPATVLERVFEPFFTTKAPGKGTGLGLAQVHAFARGSSGRVTVDSEFGKGTRVRIELPRHCLAGAPEGPEQAMDATAQFFASGTAILIVDDNSDVLESTSLLLQQAGYAVRTADSAQAALSILADGSPPDVLLSDIVMPGALDGLALAREVRERHTSMAIVLASGYSAATAEARSDGFFVLQKPYDSQALLLALSTKAEWQARATGRAVGAAATVVQGL
jgi:signal transduction histidine kinase/ActR/RegA family two-component response regulator